MEYDRTYDGFTAIGEEAAKTITGPLAAALRACAALQVGAGAGATMHGRCGGWGVNQLRGAAVQHPTPASQKPLPLPLSCRQHLSLRVQFNLRFCPSADLAPGAQAQLRSLALVRLPDVAGVISDNDETLEVVGPLAALPALEHLHLEAERRLRLRGVAGGLPPALTSLVLGEVSEGAEEGGEEEGEEPQPLLPQVSGGRGGAWCLCATAPARPDPPPRLLPPCGHRLRRCPACSA